MRSFAKDTNLTEDNRGRAHPYELAKVLVVFVIFCSTLLAAACGLCVDAVIRNLTADFTDFTDSL